ncbi:MAG: ATPase, T2SS/T4P/T4SS family [Tepidisphaeraceae bacterium]
MADRRSINPVDSDASGDAVVIVDRLLAGAVAAGASDIHVDPAANECVVRLRVDGMLRHHLTLTPAVGRSVVNRLMVLARLLTYRLDVPQEGRATVTVGDRKIDARVAMMPTTFGLRCVVRLPNDLDLPTAQPRSIDRLGLPDAALAALQAFLKSDSGLLLVVGPAGSGKTTTLHAALLHLAQTRPDLSLISIEDPVERHLPGVTQIEVTPFGELTFDRALRSVLRQDPQVLAIGEIRDAETASLALQAALSGHRLLCTLHAGSPAGAIARLLEMGLEPYRLAGAISAVVNQRLVRKLARKFGSSGVSVVFPNNDQVTADRGVAPAQHDASSTNPSEHRTDGSSPTYQGRALLAECATMTPDLRRRILDRSDVDSLAQGIASARAPTLLDHARQLIAQGLTDAGEVERVLGVSPVSPTPKEST